MSDRKRFNRKPGSKAPKDLYKKTYGKYRIRGKRHRLENLGKIWRRRTGNYSQLSNEGWLELDVKNNYEFEIMETMCEAADMKYKFHRP